MAYREMNIFLSTGNLEAYLDERNPLRSNKICDKEVVRGPVKNVNPSMPIHGEWNGLNQKNP